MYTATRPSGAPRADQRWRRSSWIRLLWRYACGAAAALGISASTRRTPDEPLFQLASSPSIIRLGYSAARWANT